jgi:hypothetical protein
MKMKLLGIGIVLVGGVLAMACVSTTYQPIYVDPRVTSVEPAAIDDSQPFRDDLAPYGQWVWVEGPGWVWSPYSMPAGWRPYQLGHWVLTDYGWTWSSDEDFGWAVYHYGRWHQTPNYGWVWVPGTEWGPAWVAWHEGGGYVGWAPLPWQVRWQAGVGLDWGGLNVNVAISPSSWYFVETRHLLDPGLRSYIAPAARNVTLIQVTRNVTNYTYIDNRIINQSVKVETIGRAIGHEVPRYHVKPAESPDVARGCKVKGQEFVVFRPNGNRGRGPQGHPVPPGHDDREHPGNPRIWSAPTEAVPPAAPADAESAAGRKDKPGRMNQMLERQRRLEQALHGAAPAPAPAPPAAPEGRATSTPAATARPDSPGRSDGTARSDGPAPAAQPAVATTPAAKAPAKAAPAKAKAKNSRDAASKAGKHKPDAADPDTADSGKPKAETPGSEN